MDLEVFFKEKDLQPTTFEIKIKDETHFIGSEDIIELILKTKGDERKKISGTLSVLDFRNSSIMDYLEYLATNLISEIVHGKRG